MLEFIAVIAFFGLIVGIIATVKKGFKLFKIPNRKIGAFVIAFSIITGIVAAGAIDGDTNTANDKTENQVDENNEENNEETDEQASNNKEEKIDTQEDKVVTNTVKEDNQTENEKSKKQTKLNTLKAHFIDVGQADAALIEYADGDKQYHILIDSGDWNSNATVNYLNEIGVSHLDLVVGSHPHADHIGQMDNILNQFKVDEVWMSGDIATSQVFDRVIDAIDTNDVGYDEPRTGDSYDIGPLQIDIVSPDSVHGQLNDGSIVMKLTYGSTTFLFTGDAEKQAEQNMLHSGKSLSADILKVGHHGSNTSSTQGFIDKVDPEVAIMSVGKSNKYGHPDADVVSRYESKKIDLYATKDHGTIIVETDGNDYNVKTNKDGTVTPESTKANNNTEAKKESTSKKEEKPKSSQSKNCIDINSASNEQVQEIIHIGPERSADLLDLRPFDSIDDLTKIKGIGPARIDDIKSQGKACVGG